MTAPARTSFNNNNNISQYLKSRCCFLLIFNLKKVLVSGPKRRIQLQVCGWRWERIVEIIIIIGASLSEPHSYVLTWTFVIRDIIGSAEALPILCVRYFRWERERDTERERDRDGSDVTIFSLKLAMNLHSPLPKIRTIGNELTLSLAKNSHFSFLPSHLPSLPSRRGHHCGAEIRNEFTLSIAKIFFRPLCSPSFKWHEPRRVIENPRQLIKSCPAPFCSSHRKNESN